MDGQIKYCIKTLIAEPMNISCFDYGSFATKLSGNNLNM